MQAKFRQALGYNYFEGGKSSIQPTGMDGPWKSQVFGAQMALAKLFAISESWFSGPILPMTVEMDLLIKIVTPRDI